MHTGLQLHHKTQLFLGQGGLASTQCTEVHFAGFFSGIFTTMAVIDSPKKLAKPLFGDPQYAVRKIKSCLFVF